MSSHLRLLGVSCLECFRQSAVERPPAQPGHVLIDRVARQGMPEGGAAGFDLDDQAGREQLVESILVADRGHEVELETVARHRSRLGRSASVSGKVARLKQDRVADRLWQRHVAIEPQLDAVVAGLQQPSSLQGGGELFDEEGDPARTVVQRSSQPLGRAVAENALGQLRAATHVERLERQLAERAVSPQVVAQSPELMRAGDLVGAVHAEHEHGQLAQRRGQRGQELECGVVGPLEVVEQHDRGSLGHNGGQAAPDRLEQRGPVALLYGLAELRQQQSQMRAQRAHG